MAKSLLERRLIDVSDRLKRLRAELAVADEQCVVLVGEAEAEIIFLRGEAEAKAMNVKATAYQEWNQAAVIDKLISTMPEVVRALASPLEHVDKITIVSTGGDTAGMNKITGDLTKMAAQIPALFETRNDWPAGNVEWFEVVRLGVREPSAAT